MPWGENKPEYYLQKYLESQDREDRLKSFVELLSQDTDSPTTAEVKNWRKKACQILKELYPLI